MSKIILLFLMPVAGLVIISCGGQEKNNKANPPSFNPAESTKLQKEVERIHDEIMPELVTIERLSQKINTLKSDSTNLSEKQITELETAGNELSKADNAMWDWMYAYKPNTYQDETRKRSYLLEQRIQILKVKSKIYNSIGYAESTLQQYETE